MIVNAFYKPQYFQIFAMRRVAGKSNEEYEIESATIKIQDDSGTLDVSKKDGKLTIYLTALPDKLEDWKAKKIQ